MEKIEDCISFLLGKAYQQVTYEAKKRLDPYKVTPVQYALLKILWETDGQSGVELATRLQLDGATVTGMLDRLEHAHFIERRPDTKDRRINRLYLTEQGRALQEPLDREMDELNQEVFGKFSPEDAEKLRKMLNELGKVKG